MHSSHIPINKEELAVNTKNFMSMLEDNPSRIASYFKHEKIAYAAGWGFGCLVSAVIVWSFIN